MQLNHTHGIVITHLIIQASVVQSKVLESIIFKKIIDGEIKLKRGQVAELDETGVILDDGTHLDADLVVYATGYNSMNGWVADLMGQDMADTLGECWGLGSDTTKDPGPWEGEP